MRRMEGRIAIVTGGGLGIGRATALLIAEEGGSVVVADILEDEGQKTVQMIHAKNGEASFLKTDVSNSDQVEALVRETQTLYGGLDFLHVNAGIPGPHHLIRDTTYDEWIEVFDINLNGAFHSCRAAIPALTERGGGAIVLTASDLGIKPMMYAGAYSASKAAMISLGKTLAIECAPLRIRVNIIAPGETDTRMGVKSFTQDASVVEAWEKCIPLGRIASPEEMAQAIVFMASDQASYLTGEVLLVDGGRMLFDPSPHEF